jgi:hypothetical protein
VISGHGPRRGEAGKHRRQLLGMCRGDILQLEAAGLLSGLWPEV